MIEDQTDTIRKLKEVKKKQRFRLLFLFFREMWGISQIVYSTPKIIS